MHARGIAQVGVLAVVGRQPAQTIGREELGRVEELDEHALQPVDADDTEQQLLVPRGSPEQAELRELVAVAQARAVQEVGEVLEELLHEVVGRPLPQMPQ